MANSYRVTDLGRTTPWAEVTITDGIACWPDGTPVDFPALEAQGYVEQVQSGGVRHVTLGFIAHGDAGKPRTVRLMIQDQDFTVLSLVDLSEHDFTALMAGQSVRVEAEI